MHVYATNAHSVSIYHYSCVRQLQRRCHLIAFIVALYTCTIRRILAAFFVLTSCAQCCLQFELEGRSLTSNSNPPRFQSPIKFYFSHTQNKFKMYSHASLGDRDTHTLFYLHSLKLYFVCSALVSVANVKSSDFDRIVVNAVEMKWNEKCSHSMHVKVFYLLVTME